MPQPFSTGTRHRRSSLVAGHKSRKGDAIFHPVALIIKIILY